MIINELPGKFYCQALFRDYYYKGDEKIFSPAWSLSTNYFDSRASAVEFFGHENVQWPADGIAEGTVYIPSEEELHEAEGTH